jgi:hypothetical protein
MRTFLRTALRTVWAIIREISDENAYQRHLRYHGRKHSAAEWRIFSDKRFARKYARAKCC